ncbi:MAG: hypothetical protein ABSG25_09270 [Bryobacteraceae bacterium]
MNVCTARGLLLSGIMAGLMGLAACSNQPEPPKMGSSEFHWDAAKKNYASGDYQQASEHLAELCKRQNQYSPIAQIWSLVLDAGLSQGYTRLADEFERGAKVNRSTSTPLLRQVEAYRSYSSTAAVNFAEEFDRFQQSNQDDMIALQFELPSGTAEPPLQLSQVAHGRMLQPGILEETVKQSLKGSILIEICRVVGAGDDPVKGKELFNASVVKIPRELFLLAMANALYEQAQIFTPNKLDAPDRFQFFISRATQTLKQLPESKDTKELSNQIQKTVKTTKWS